MPDYDVAPADAPDVARKLLEVADDPAEVRTHSHGFTVAEELWRRAFPRPKRVSKST